MNLKSFLTVLVGVSVGMMSGCSLSKKAEEGSAAATPATAGFTKTASGLQYQVIKEGVGKKPKATDTVVVHYRGTRLDGREFDSSRDRGPATFPLNGVVKGWTEGLQLMSEGAQYRFIVPPDLAYGAQGAPGGIVGPNATLIFEVALLQVR